MSDAILTLIAFSVCGAVACGMYRLGNPEPKAEPARVPTYASCDALETAGGVLIGLGSCLALLAIGAFWCLMLVAVARVALG